MIKRLLLFAFISLFYRCHEDSTLIDTRTTEETVLIEEYEHYLKTTDDEGNEKIYINCKARQTNDETLITAVDTTGEKIIIIGIKGFETGTHIGNLLGIDGVPVSEIEDQTTINVESYDDKGGEIIGTFNSGPVEGDFVAYRIR